MEEIDEQRVSLGDAFPGVEVFPVEEGSTPLDAIVIFKSLDPHGRVVWSIRHSEGISAVEMIGALTVTLKHEKEVFQATWIDEDD